jgi:hypothetical protein
MHNIFVLFVLAFITLSCGKAPSMPEYTSKTFEPLAGKSNSEILNLKYDNSINLKCVIYLQDKPVDHFQWRIPGELSLMRLLHYKIDNKEMIAVVKLSEGLKFFESYTHKDEYKNEYYMEQSPYLKINFRRGPKTILSDGSVHNVESFAQKTIFENIDSRLFAYSTIERNEDDRDAPPRIVKDELRCMLATQINPPYRHQWRRVK